METRAKRWRKATEDEIVDAKSIYQQNYTTYVSGPWSIYAAHEMKAGNDYADFVGFEKWMEERSVTSSARQWCDEWDEMPDYARVALFALMTELRFAEDAPEVFDDV